MGIFEDNEKNIERDIIQKIKEYVKEYPLKKAVSKALEDFNVSDNVYNIGVEFSSNEDDVFVDIELDAGETLIDSFDLKNRSNEE